jgi:anti-sigma B factor antagonist
MEVASAVGERLVAQITPTTRLLVVEASKLDFLESTGLGGMVAGYLRIRRNRGDLRLVKPQPAIMALLEMTRLTQLFRVCDSVEEALRLPIL